MEVRERDVTPFDLVTADEVFLAGTKSEMLAVGTIGGTKIGSGGVGPIARVIYREFSRVVQRPDEGTQIYEAESVET